MDIYSILSHSFRRKILLLLEKEGYIPYTDLMEKLGLETTGQLNFHLKKIGSLIGKDKKSYFLTEDGKRVLKILNLNKRILSGEYIDEYLDSKGSEISRIGVIICNCNTEISSVIDITALENLLINAVKYNDNPYVEIKVKISNIQNKETNYLKIEIKDNGIGISDERKGTIFERRFNKDKYSKGKGFGLSLVKKIIKKYNGKIWVEDKVAGDHSKGSNFIMLIPQVFE